jgi:hypothetical protein
MELGRNVLLGFICPETEIPWLKLKAFNAGYKMVMAGETPQV